jgi:hypothetical protein
VILAPIEGETEEEFLLRYNAIAKSLGYPQSPESDWLSDEADSEWRGFGDQESRSASPQAESREAADCGRDEKGQFGEKNKCQEDGDGSSGDTATAAKGSKKSEEDIPLGNVRRQDVMLRGGRSVVVIDREATERAKQDRVDNPKPPDSHPASTSDLYGRTFVRRDDPKKPNKITSHDPVFTDEDLAQNDMYVAHDAAGRFLSGRHEDERRAAGGEGPGAVIDTRRDLTPEQFDYVVSALKEDVDRAYEEGRNPGFYSTDIAECMDTMSSMYPELRDESEAKRLGTTPEDASFVFTMITAITSNGTDPALNLESADRIYRLYREHGSVRTNDDLMGGPRAAKIRESLGRFQDMIDEFGESRVRSLMSGVTHASSINTAMKKLARRSKEIGGSWGDRGVGDSELPDEVVPVAAVFGPKIGSFFANLSGRHQFLTMDRWLMRSVGRVTGELLSRSSPESANKQANLALKTLRAIKGKEGLFGVDKPPLSLKRQDVIRSLELQARSGIVEESGAAYEWAKAAERAYNKVPRGVDKDGKPKGSYGDHPDPQVRAAHKAGNAMAKSLVHEQQDPRSARARRVLREVFREVARRVEADSPDSREGVQVSEIQAVLWQYEQNLWKKLGAKTKIEGDSLYSAAAKSLKASRDSGNSPKALTPQKSRRPKSVRSEDRAGESDDGVETDYPNQSGQDLWDDEIETAGVDVQKLLKAVSEDIVAESRSCVKAEGGRFGPGNDCAADGGSTAVSDSPRARVDNSWKKMPEAVQWTGDDLKSSPPAKSLSGVKSVTMADAELVGDSLKVVGVTLDQAAKTLAPVGNKDASVQILHGTLTEAARYLSDPSLPREPSASVTFSSQVSVAGIADAVQTAATLTRTDEEELLMTYSMFAVKPEAQQNAKFAVAREMMRGVVDSISQAEKLGVSDIMMHAAGSEASEQFKGYRLWPKLGFDGIIDRHIITPTWSVRLGFFEPYGSSLPDSILSPRAQQEKRSGKLTVQALYETAEGQDWWEQNGREMFMTILPGRKDSPGWQRFQRMRDKFSSRSLSVCDAFGDSAECRSLMDEVWAEFRFDPNQPRENDGKFASKAGGGGPTTIRGEAIQDWGKSRETEIWTPDRPLIRGAENIPSIRIEKPSDVRGIAEDELKMPISDVVSVGGPVIDAAKRAGITLPRMEIRPDDFGGLHISWTARGVATGRGFAEDEKEYVEVGQSVNAVEASRTLQRSRSGIVMSMNGFFIHPDFQGMGLALESHVRSLSVSSERVKMTAERYDTPNPMNRMTGYKAWIKYGYNAPMSKVSLRVPIPEKFSSAKTLLDVYRIPGGREWWAEVGHSIDLEFDRRPRSDSIETLLKLQDAIRAKHSRRSVDMTVDQDRVGIDCDLDKIVDEVWDEFVKEGPSGKTGNSPTQEDWDRWDQENAELKAKDGKEKSERD